MTKQSAAPGSGMLSASQSFSALLELVGRGLVTLRETSRRGFPWSRRTLSLPAAVVLIGAFCVSARAQYTLAPSWSQQSPATSPPERYIHGMTYDAGHAQVVLFGGFGQSGYLNDTWLYNGTTWTQANPDSSPSPRAAVEMAYDAAHSQVVLFGGLTSVSSRTGDTWLWNGTNWTQASPAISPPARASASMVYVPGQGVLLFGGVSAAGEDLSDTWLWNGTNWTQQTPVSNPSARADYGMAYDAALGEVVLFGGDDLYGDYLNDTWIWNGTTWTQANPANNPPARYAQGMDYDAALGQVVMFSGYNGSFLDDTWSFNGANWIQDTVTTSPSGRYAPNGMVYDAAQSEMILFGGLNSVQLSDTWTFAPSGNFGSVNVCPVGATTPAPCSETLSFTVNISTLQNLGTPQVLTQGASGLDFTLASGSTCAGVGSTGSCVVNVTFTPTAPGPRTGAVQLMYPGQTGVALSIPVYGVGQGPAAAIAPGTQSSVPITGLSQYTVGVAVDAAGNTYVADYVAAKVVKVTPGGVQTTVPATGLSSPIGVAVDGAGDVYIVDQSLSYVVEVTPSGTQTTLGSGLSNPIGIALDGAGDVFVGDQNNNRVVKITSGGVQTTVPFTGLNHTWGVAVDAQGDVFAADGANSRVVEVTPTGVQTTVPATGLKQPYDIAVDAAGDVYIADPQNGRVVEVPAGGGPQTNVGAGLNYPSGVTVDGAGDVFIGDQGSGQVFEVNRSQPPSLFFATTNVGSTSSDSPKSVILENVGNQALNAVGSGLVIVGAGFTQVAGQGTPGDCSASFALTPGQGCNLSLSFTPQGPGNPLTGSVGFFDNALNAISTAQSVGLAGTAIASTFSLNVSTIGGGMGTVADNLGEIACSAANGATLGLCSGPYPSGTQVTLAASATGTSAFTGWGGVCASAGTSSTCSVLVSQIENVTASFVNQSFGNVNACSVGQNSPAPCSTTLPVTFNLATSTTIGAIRVVTQGATGLDFSQGSGGSCVGTVPGGSSCTVNVNFAPLAPGLRLGAVQLYDNNADLIGSTPIYGIGQEPEVALGPGTQSTVNTGTLSTPKGVLVDAAGNLFVSDTTLQQVMKIAPNGTRTTVGVGLQFPQGMAEDGAGDLFIADNNLNQIVEVPAGCTTSACQQVLGANLRSQLGVAVDGQGDVFIGDFLDGEVAKSPAGCTTAACQSVVYNPGGGSNPVGLTVDAAGDLFVADYGLKQVVEIPAGCTVTNCQVKVGSGWSQPDGVAVDAAGDVYVADAGLGEIVEIPAGCTSTGCQVVLASGVNTVAVTLDGAGDLFFEDFVNKFVDKISRSQAPSFTFATTNVGTASTDSPRSIALQNIGNQPLTGSLTLNIGGSFTQTASLDCSTAFPLAPGASCIDTFSFIPQSATFFTGTAVFTDNDLNLLSATQIVNLSGTGATNGAAGTVAVPNVVGQAQSAVSAPITALGLALGTVSTASSSAVPSGSVISQNPAAGTQVAVGSMVNLLVSSGQAQPPSANPLLLENNYFVTGDFVSSGVTLRGTGVGGTATGSIAIPSYAQNPTNGVPGGADIVDAYLYWQTLENTAFASSTGANFNGYPIVGQQIGTDLPNYVDGQFTGTMRSYRAAVNAYLPVGANGIRIVSGSYSVSLPDGGTALPLTEGASLVMVYRVLSPNFPLKSVIIYDGAAAPTVTGTQVVQGFYDAVGGASGTGKSSNLFASGGKWNSNFSSVTLGQSNQYSAPLNAASAYAAVILSTAVNNSDNDGILDAWKTGPSGNDFHAGQPGYYDTKTGTWVGLPGAKHGEKDLFVQLDYMCGAVLANGSCDPTQENLFPSPDANGNDPLAMVQQAFANSGVQLHLQIGNAVPESTCVDDNTTTPATLCQFPNQPGVVGWKNSLEFSKLYPRNLAACLSGGDCTTRFPYGQKDSYHYVLMGHSLAIPAWNTRYGTLTSITVANGATTITTTDRGTGINACPSRITLAGVIGNPALNGVYNTTGCADTKTITFATPGVPNFTYPNNILPEPVIGLTSGTISSISGYSDLGGEDSAVTLGLWLTYPNQDMSKRANVLAGTIFHEIGHTLGLSHGGLYYDTPNSYIPTFEGNCKPNYQSVMNYLFQLDLVGPNQTLAFSNQALNTVNENTAGSVTQLTDPSNNPATFPTSAWYVPYTAGSTVSPATLHCDGTPLNGESGYRIDAPIAPITPPWTNGQDLSFTGTLQSSERGYNDLTSLDLRQTGATGGEFASLSSVFSFGSSVTPLDISAGGTVALGSGGTVALGSGGTVALGSGGTVTLSSGGTITLTSGGTIALGSGGNVTLGSSGGTITPGSNGAVALGSGGTVALSSGGTIALGSGGTVALGSGGTVALGSGGTIALGSGGTVTIPSSGGSYTLNSSGGTIALGSGGTVALGSGGVVTLSGAGTIALGSGGTVALGSGGTIALGSGGTVALGSGGTIALGSGGNVTLSSGGTIALGSGGTIALGSGGTVALGSGGTVTLGGGGTVALGSGGTVALGSGGTATVGAGGSVTLSAGGTVALGSGGTVALGSGGTIALGSGGTVALGSGGTVTLASGGTIALGSGGSVTIPSSGGSYTLNSAGGTIALGSGGTVALGSGGTVTLSAGGTIALGSGGTIALGSGGKVTLANGGVVNLGPGGSVTMGSGTGEALGTVSNITPASGGPLSANELTYETANSVVRPPSSPTETSTPAGVRITWKAPAFGVVQTYTIYRSSNSATPIVIGSVSGVNGNPPATEFTDTSPDLTSATVVYTVTTTLVPDAAGPSRQSVFSPPAVLKNDQSIILGPLPSSVTIGNPPTITATAMSGGVPNGLQVVFSATGSCAIGSQSIAANVSSATVTLNSIGSCIVSASQPGTTTFNAANTVSGTFMVLPLGSATKSQTITFAPLPSAQYGGTFALSASSSSGLPVSFTASGPCTTSGGISGVGLCTITAAALANSTYSAASLTQTFNIYPAVLKVTANSLAVTYGQPLPSLTFAYSGFVNSDSASVVSGVPALSTTASTTSNAGVYPIAVSKGTLATTNYSFLYVSGTLTVQPANQTALTLITTSPLTYGQSETMSVAGGSTGGAITYNLISGPCSISGARLTATSGSGACKVTATMAGNSNYNAVTSAPANMVSLSLANETITFTTSPPSSAAYNTSFMVAATGGASATAVVFTSAGVCSNSGAVYTMTNSTGTCSVIVNQAGNSNYAAAAQVTKSVTATGPIVSVSPSSINFGTVYEGSISIQNVTVSNIGTAPVTITDPILSLVKGGDSSEFISVNLCPKPLAAGKSCTITIAFLAGPYYNPQTATLQIMSNAPGSPQLVPLSALVINPEAIFNQTSLNFGTIKHSTSSTLNVTLRNPGSTPLLLTRIGVTDANAASFVQNNNCGSSLAAGASCTVAIKFTPPAVGTFSANLTVIDNAQCGSGMQTVSLSGKGN